MALNNIDHWLERFTTVALGSMATATSTSMSISTVSSDSLGVTDEACGIWDHPKVLTEYAWYQRATKKLLSFKDELQSEIDEWLKDST